MQEEKMIRKVRNVLFIPVLMSLSVALVMAAGSRNSDGGVQLPVDRHGQFLRALDGKGRP
jgi:hypothetical protein